MNLIEARARIRQASAEAPDRHEIDKLRDRENKVCRDFLLGNMGLEEFSILTESVFRPGQIKVPDVGDFRLIMKCLGIGLTDIYQTIAHELAHCKVALSFGLHPELGVQMERDHLYQPHYSHAFTEFKFPSGMRAALARKALRDIIQAPGVDMCDDDCLCLPEMTNGVRLGTI